jgi:2-methylcitrate dehydratase PrpD
VVAVTEPLARLVAESRWADIPDSVRHEAKRSLLNYFAVALGGCTDPTIAKAAGVMHRFRANEAATVIGRNERTDMLNAAALNAMSANVYDFDDTHIPTIIHPTAPVASALLALAEARTQLTPISGTQWLHAFVLGVEIECRIGNAISPGHYNRGWHITSTCGVFGAAAAAGRALGLTAQQLGWAFGSASAQACGLVETLGTMSKSMSVGNAARNGLLSALLAEADFDGPAAPLEGVRGFLNVTGDNPDFAGLTEGLGQHWELSKNTYKPYPCGVVLNPVIDACLALHADPALALRHITRIEVVGHPLLRQRTDRPGVRTGRESQVSAQHAVPIALTTGRAGLEEFSDTAVARADVQALGRKVCFTDDASLSIDAARVIITQTSGETLTSEFDFARGSLHKPLTDSEIENKLRALCRYGRSGCAPEPLIDAVWGLDGTADVSVLMGLVRGVTR